jgi:hypothetical protein
VVFSQVSDVEHLEHGGVFCHLFPNKRTGLAGIYGIIGSQTVIHLVVFDDTEIHPPDGPSLFLGQVLGFLKIAHPQMDMAGLGKGNLHLVEIFSHNPAVTGNSFVAGFSIKPAGIDKMA